MHAEDILIQLGLTKLEAKAYLALLSLGSSTALPIARKAGIKRTSIYNFIDHLIDLGLVSKTTQNSRTIFIAEPPDRLTAIIEEKKEMLLKNLEDLKSLFSNKIETPVFRYVRGATAVKEFYKDSLKMEGRLIRFIATKESAIAYLGATFTNRIIEEYSKRGIEEMTLRELGKNASHKYKNSDDNKRLGRQVREMPREVKLEFAVIIYDDIVGLFAPIRENYGFIVKSGRFAHMMTVFFKQIWQVSKEL